MSRRDLYITVVATLLLAGGLFLAYQRGRTIERAEEVRRQFLFKKVDDGLKQKLRSLPQDAQVAILGESYFHKSLLGFYDGSYEFEELKKIGTPEAAIILAASLSREDRSVESNLKTAEALGTLPCQEHCVLMIFQYLAQFREIPKNQWPRIGEYLSPEELALEPKVREKLERIALKKIFITMSIIDQSPSMAELRMVSGKRFMDEACREAESHGLTINAMDICR